MTIFKKTTFMITAIISFLVFASAAEAATTYKYVGTDPSYLAGEITIDGSNFDWTKLIVSPSYNPITAYHGIPTDNTSGSPPDEQWRWIAADRPFCEGCYALYSLFPSPEDNILRINFSLAGFEYDAEIENLNFGGYVIFESIPPVPIPAAAFMFAPALLGFLGLRRRKMQA
jgi:hypothetical protein